MNELLALLRNFPTDTPQAIARVNAILAVLGMFPTLISAAVPARYKATKSYATANPEKVVAVLTATIQALTDDEDLITAILADVSPSRVSATVKPPKLKAAKR